MPCLRECSSEAAMIEAVTQHVAQHLKEALAQEEQAVLVVSGGRSPASMFQSLSAQPLAWGRVAVTLADERWVPPDHADSNEALVRRHLLRSRAASARFVPLWTGKATPESSVPTACEALAALPRPFSQVVLGMGVDGHIASLFPGSSGWAEGLGAKEAVLATHPPRAARGMPHARLTLSLQALLEARDIVLMIMGHAKRRVLERALREGPVEELPVRALLRQSAVPVSVFWAP